VAAGRFRRDLLYRVDVIRIRIPPLRERPEDVAVLAEHFWRAAAGRVGSRAALSPGVLSALARYHWPGNVRELQNVIAALAVDAPSRGLVRPTLLPAAIAGATPIATRRLADARAQFERRCVEVALARACGNRTRAAAELGLSRQGLLKTMARLGIGGRGEVKGRLTQRRRVHPAREHSEGTSEFERALPVHTRQAASPLMSWLSSEPRARPVSLTTSAPSMSAGVGRVVEAKSDGRSGSINAAPAGSGATQWSIRPATPLVPLYTRSSGSAPALRVSSRINSRGSYQRPFANANPKRSAVSGPEFRMVTINSPGRSPQASVRAKSG
jgi:hypothetical protein